MPQFLKPRRKQKVVDAALQMSVDGFIVTSYLDTILVSCITSG